MGKSADKKALTVTETSSGSVHSGMAVATIYQSCKLLYVTFTPTVTTYLIDELSTMDIIGNKNLRPELELTTLDEVTGLLLEHGVLIGDRDELFIAEALRVRNVGEIRISSLAKLANNKRFVQLLTNIS